MTEKVMTNTAGPHLLHCWLIVATQRSSARARATLQDQAESTKHGIQTYFRSAYDANLLPCVQDLHRPDPHPHLASRAELPLRSRGTRCSIPCLHLTRLDGIRLYTYSKNPWVQAQVSFTVCSTSVNSTNFEFSRRVERRRCDDPP